MPARRLKDYLESRGVKYESLRHYEMFTAQETAQMAHVPGRELAKTVMVRIDGRIAMVVLPAPEKVDFGLLKGAAGARAAELAAEEEFTDLFPDCEVGAMPPFGNLYDIDVYVDEALTRDEQIAFNAGTHLELIRMAYKDFEKLVGPKVARLSSGYK